MLEVEYVKKTLLILLTITALIFVFTGCNKTPPAKEDLLNDTPSIESPDTMPFEGYTAPDFTVEKLSGGSLKASSLCGTMMVINFWSLDSDGALEDLPHFDELYPKMSQDRTILMVNLGDHRHEIRRFIDKSSYNFLVYLDDDSSMAETFAITEVPTTIVIGPDNKVLARAEGRLGQIAIDYLSDPATYSRPMVPG